MHEWSAERREEVGLGSGVEVRWVVGVGVGQTGTVGVNPSTDTTPHHSAALNATRRHGEAHLFVLYRSALLKENDCS